MIHCSQQGLEGGISPTLLILAWVLTFYRQTFGLPSLEPFVMLRAQLQIVAHIKDFIKKTFIIYVVRAGLHCIVYFQHRHWGF